jgi:hypothetical protein
VSATLLAGFDTVRLVYDSLVVPGDVTIGISNMLDLAGNAIVAVPASNVTSTDTASPLTLGTDARAVAVRIVRKRASMVATDDSVVDTDESAR